MEDQSTKDRKESRLYLFPRNWLEITISILFMFLVMFCIAYFGARFRMALPVLAVIFLFLWWPLFDALRILPFSTVGIRISEERIALLKRNGKEKKIITQVTEVKTGGLARRVEIMGLSPEGERTKIKLERKDLTKGQYKELRLRLQELFPAGN